MAASSSRKADDVYDMEAVLSLLDAGFFDNDEEILKEVNSLQTELAEEKECFTCDVQGCDKQTKTKGGLRRHVMPKHPEVINAENLKRQDNQTQEAADRLGPLYLKKYISEIAKKLSQDECYPEDFRASFLNFLITSMQAQLLFGKCQDSIRKFKGNPDVFYSEFCQLSMQDDVCLMVDRKAQHLLFLELSTKCITHMTARDNGTSRQPDGENQEISLSDKEFAALQYLSGHVVHKTYLELRKSKHWREENFQECINLLRSFKIDPTEEHKLVKARDRGGLWYL